VDSVSAENANLQILAPTPLCVTQVHSQPDKFAVPPPQPAAPSQNLTTSVLPTSAMTKPDFALPTPPPPFNVDFLKTPLASTDLVFLPLVFARPIKPENAQQWQNAQTPPIVMTTTYVLTTAAILTELVSGQSLIAAVLLLETSVTACNAIPS